jgi:hypothetical protein
VARTVHLSLPADAAYVLMGQGTASAAAASAKKPAGVEEQFTEPMFGDAVPAGQLRHAVCSSKHGNGRQAH